MKKGKRLSKADALRVLRRAYNLIKKMFKPVNRKNGDFWFHSSKKNIRLHIIDTLIDIYNGNDHPDIVERVARKIRSIF